MIKDRLITQWKQCPEYLWEPPGRSRNFLRSVYLSAAGTLARPDDRVFLRLLYCHYVFDDQREKFSRVIERLRRIGTFVNTDTCLAMLEGKKAIDGKYFHLSFDDGFKNVITNAIPILKKNGVPAITFVPTGLVGAAWEKVQHYCITTVKYPGVIEMAGWEDLQRAVDAGYEVGSHTKMHARFCDISSNLERMEDEILGSRLELEKRLGVECKYISWPNGRMCDVDDRSLSYVDYAGYSACFSAVRGSVLPRRTNEYRIPRHHFEVQWPMSHIEYFAQGNNEHNQLLMPSQSVTAAGSTVHR